MQVQRSSSPNINTRQPLLATEQRNYFAAQPPVARMDTESTRPDPRDVAMNRMNDIRTARANQPAPYYSRVSNSDLEDCAVAAAVPCCGGITVGVVVAVCAFL